MERQQLFDAIDGNEAGEAVTEKWLRDLDRINAILNQQRHGMFRRVKIAILDTGIDMTNDLFSAEEARKRIKKREDFLREDPLRTDAHDKYGHGSHCAGLLRRTAPAADIYVARVAKDSDTEIDPQVVVNAIERAYKPRNEAGWDVDIITMSFGFLIESAPIANALRRALLYDKAIFAAASNNGYREGVAFPACLGGVICINSASGDGIASSFNPVPALPLNFAILGENLRSAWIPSQPNATGHKETKIKSGTSMASPIAAAVFSLLLEVTMNPDGREARSIFEHYLPNIRKSDAVQMILKNASDERGKHLVIKLEFLKKAENRLRFAHWIQETLCQRYGEPGVSESNRDQLLTLDPPPPQPTPSRIATAPPIRQEIRPPPVASNSTPLPTRGEATNPTRLYSPRIPTRPPLATVATRRLFYTLTNGDYHILPKAKSYWGHLTLAAYEVYEGIYEDCKDPDSGWVYYSSFADQFCPVPPPGTMESTWGRLLPEQGNMAGSRHPKGLAMAALYMLHLEYFGLGTMHPPSEDGGVSIDEWQRTQLEGFGNWVGCRCKAHARCAVMWNFVNKRGLHRGGEPKSCVLAKFIDSGGKVGLFDSAKEHVGLLSAVRQDWQDSLKR
ncbi:hypothetical protein RB595_001433 [Gaeumannomyces hyphopodioides]